VPQSVSGLGRPPLRAYSGGMAREPETFIECSTGEEVGRALAQGLAAIAAPSAAADCGAEPGDPDELDDVLESHLRPYGGEPAPEAA